MDRKILKKVVGKRGVDGAGVSLVRVLGHDTTDEFDPILMLDSFDSENPDDYTAGFPMHPHRGIETISYVFKGKMVHKDSLGNEDAISDGEVQWMNSGSGIMHEEMIPESPRLLGVQLWLNLPAERKMSRPSYRSIRNSEITEVEVPGGKVRVLSGAFGGVLGHAGDNLPLNYYDIHLGRGFSLQMATEPENTVILFTLSGSVGVGGEAVDEKTAVKLSRGEIVEITALSDVSQVLFISSKPLNEPVAWAGPIVMNTKEEIQQAYADLRSGNFIRERAEY